MRAHTLRMWVLGLVVAAALISLVGSRTGSHLVSSLGFLVFLGAVCVYAIWRRTVSRERAARVFDRESKTDETRTRTDQ